MIRRDEASRSLEPIPRARAPWLVFFGLSLLMIALGVFAYSVEHSQGTIVTGLRTPGHGGASWGLYIVFVVYFIGVSFAGIAVAALARLFEIAVLKPVSRIAELLTLVSLVAGAACIVADLGRPEVGLIKLPRFANPSSPFFGTFTLVVSGYLFSSLVFFFLAGRADAATASRAEKGLLRRFLLAWASGYRDLPAQRLRHWRASFWLSMGILPLLVIAHSTLGFVFGIQGGRPGWFGALQAPSFVVLAGVSGTGTVILVALWFRWLFRLHDRLPDSTFRWLGNFLWILTLVYLYFMIVEELTASYAAPEADREIAHEIVAGHFAPLFWLTVGNLFLTFFIPFWLYLRKRTSIHGIAIASVLANVAAVSKRMLIVIPSQTHGELLEIESGVYSPTWVEYGVIVGLVGMICAVMLVFGRIFPLAPIGKHEVDGTLAHRDGLVRPFVSGFVALVAISLISVGLADSFRLWSGEAMDPRIPYSPVVFAFGVMLLFISVVVYELWPDPKEKSHAETWGGPRGSVDGARRA